MSGLTSRPHAGRSTPDPAACWWPGNAVEGGPEACPCAYMGDKEAAPALACRGVTPWWKVSDAAFCAPVFTALSPKTASVKGNYSK